MQEKKMREGIKVGLLRINSLTRCHVSQNQKEIKERHVYVWAGLGEGQVVFHARAKGKRKGPMLGSCPEARCFVCWSKGNKREGRLLEMWDRHGFRSQKGWYVL